MANDPTSKTIGLVIKAVDYHDYDRIVDILTPSGKQTVLVRGVKKPTAKMVGAAQPFSYGEYVLYKKSGRYTVTGYNGIDSFSRLAEDMTNYACASVMLEMCDVFAFEPDEAQGIFLLTLRALHSICYQEMPPLDALCFYILKFLSITGYEPNVEQCIGCGKVLPTGVERVGFSLEGGIVCTNCRGEGDLFITKGAISDMKRTASWETEQMKLLRYSKPLLKELLLLLLPYVEKSSERRLKSVDFLRQIGAVT